MAAQCKAIFLFIFQEKVHFFQTRIQNMFLNLRKKSGILNKKFLSGWEFRKMERKSTLFFPNEMLHSSWICILIFFLHFKTFCSRMYVQCILGGFFEGCIYKVNIMYLFKFLWTIFLLNLSYIGCFHEVLIYMKISNILQALFSLFKCWIFQKYML